MKTVYWKYDCLSCDYSTKTKEEIIEHHWEIHTQKISPPFELINGKKRFFNTKKISVNEYTCKSCNWFITYSSSQMREHFWKIHTSKSMIVKEYNQESENS